MAAKHPTLRPGDVAVALRLAFEPGERYEALAEAVGMSVSSAHRSVQRLQKAGLLAQGQRKVNRYVLREFLVHGVRYAFFAEPGGRARGIPTAHAAPPLADAFPGDEPYVWPSPQGTTTGIALQPLYTGAPGVPERDERLYHALALVDALRVGRVHQRQRAAEALEALISAPLT